MLQVAVQQRRRLFREGLSQWLAAQDDIALVGSTTTCDELIVLCGAKRPTVVLVEADGQGWEPARLVTALRRGQPRGHALRVIGLTETPATAARIAAARHGGFSTLVCHDSGFVSVLIAVRNEVRMPQPGAVSAFPGKATSLPPRPPLTARELTILSLIGAGLTSREISARIGISHKTVENHKQRIFAKLGVQSQAHAVSVAMRTGLLRPDRVIDVAAAD